MKKLMIATAVAAVGLSAVADVYNVKFAAKTPVDAVNKKGEATTSLKSITIQGLWDTANDNYLFWSVNGKEYKALKNATLALVSEGKFVKNDVLNNTQVAEEYELLWGENGWGDDVTKLEGAFVASGLTKNKVAKDGTVTLTSMSGNFAGQQDGKPAYGTWTLSKNAKATKDGLLAGLPKQLADVDPSEFGEKYANLKAWKDSMNGANETEDTLEATESALAKTEGKLKGMEAALDKAVGDIMDLSGALNDKQNELDATKSELENVQETLEAIKEVVKSLHNDDLSETVSTYLDRQLKSQTKLNKEATDDLADFNEKVLPIADIDQLIKEAQDALTASNNVCVELTNTYNEAYAAYRKQKAVCDDMKALLDEKADIKESEYYKKNYLDPIAKAEKALYDYTNKTWKVVLNDASNTVASAEAALAKATTDKSAAETALSEAIEALADAEAELEAFAEEVPVLPTFEEYLAADSKRKDNLDNRVAWMKACIDILKKATSDNQADRDALVAKVAAAVKAVNDAKDAVAVATDKRETAEDDLAAAKEALAAAEEGYEEGLTKLLKDLKDLEEKRDTFLATKLPSPDEYEEAVAEKDRLMDEKDAANRAMKNEKGYLFAEQNLKDVKKLFDKQYTITYVVAEEEYTTVKVNPLKDPEIYETARTAYIEQMNKIIESSAKMIEMLQKVVDQIAEVTK